MSLVSADDCETAATAFGRLVAWSSDGDVNSPNHNPCVYREACGFVVLNSGTASGAKCDSQYECVCRRRSDTTEWLVSLFCDTAGYNDIDSEQSCKSAATALGKSLE